MSCERDNKTGQFKKTHGLTKTRIYNIWAGIKQRCCNPNKHEYKRYGGSGITICDEWKDDFMNFYDWAMAHGYKDTLTIHRVENDRGYCPENCVWTDRRTQTIERKVTKFVEVNGKSYVVPELAKMYGIDKNCLYARARKHGYTKKILDSPVVKKYQYKGSEYTLTELSKIIGLSIQTIKYRIQKGINLDDLEKPKYTVNRKATSVEQYDLEGNFIRKFNSLKEATEKTRIRASSISSCIHGKYKTAGNYIWKIEEKDVVR